MYTVFYRYDHAGIVILEFAAFVAIPMGLYTVAAAMMQGISENRRMMKYLGIGIIIKLLLQYPCIFLLQGMGPLLSTCLSMFVIDYLILHSFNMEFGLHFNQMARSTNQILCFSLIMYAVTKTVMVFLGHFISPYGRFTAFFALVLGVIIGASIFIYLALKYRLADRIIGSRSATLRQKLRIS